MKFLKNMFAEFMIWVMCKLDKNFKRHYLESQQMIKDGCSEEQYQAKLNTFDDYMKNRYKK